MHDLVTFRDVVLAFPTLIVSSVFWVVVILAVGIIFRAMQQLTKMWWR